MQEAQPETIGSKDTQATMESHKPTMESHQATIESYQAIVESHLRIRASKTLEPQKVTKADYTRASQGLTW